MNRARITLLTSLLFAGCVGDGAASDTRDGVETRNQRMVLTHEDQSFSAEFEWQPGKHPDADIMAMYGRKSGIFAVFGLNMHQAKSSRVLTDTARVNVFWTTLDDRATGEFHCSPDGPLIFAKGDPFGGSFSSQSADHPGASCTITVDEVGQIGERVRGSFEAVLVGGLSGSHTGELESFAGAFDVIRSENQIFIPE